MRPDHRCRGRWQGTVKVDEAGRRKTKYVYGRTQAEAKTKLDKANAEKRAGTLVVTTVTVDKWLNQWLNRQERRTKLPPGKGALKPATFTSYQRKADAYIRPHLGRHRLTALTPYHIEAMYDAMRDQGLAESTVRTTHIILSKLLSDAVKKGALGANPIDRTDAPSTATARRARLTVAQVNHVLSSTNNIRWWLALFYGMRQGECLGLRWCDIDWTTRTLRIQQTLQADGKVYGKPKADASERWLPMVGQIESRMRLHWIDAGSPTVAEPCQEVTGICEHGLVFPGIKPRTDNRNWHRLLASVPGVPDTTLHAARNSAADVLEAANVPARLVGQILGQARIETTHGYQYAEQERIRAALESGGRVLELD